MIFTLSLVFSAVVVLAWCGDLFNAYGNKDSHSYLSVKGWMVWTVLQEDGTVECYDVGGDLISYGVNE